MKKWYKIIIMLVVFTVLVGCRRDEGSQVFLPFVHRSPTPTATVVEPVITPTEVPATPIPEPTPTLGIPQETQVVLKTNAGMQIDPNTDDLPQVLRWVSDMGFEWVKVQVEWSILEYEPGHYRWVELDRLVQMSHEFGLKLLVSVVDAPEWLRAAPEYNGPPENPTEFGRIMGVMAPRYGGRVTAYELWNEPNLSREWYGATLDPAAFVELVSHGSRGIRETDPQALIISGAPAVTGIDDGVDAIDDRRFLRESLNAGLAEWVDGIGVHPYGYANPPEERAADSAHKAPSWNDHPSFFFLDTLEDYHTILLESGVELPLWPTEFGWPVAEGIRSNELPADFPYPYAAWVSESDQAIYLVDAIKLIAERPWVGPFFIWNLNMSVNWGSSRPEALFSLLRPDTSLRPAYMALRLTAP